MLGEPSEYCVNDFRPICSSGLEKDWILDWFGSLSTAYGYKIFSVDICRGDKLPEPDTPDAVILGGTSHDVREKFPWLTYLTGWLNQYRVLERPLLGICGGHQLLSIVFDGGELVSRKAGRLAGVYPIELSDIGRQHPLFKGIDKYPKFLFGNTLYILPSETLLKKTLASFGDDPTIVADHGGHWYSCQFHPESKKITWECFFKRDDTVDLDLFSDHHDGYKFLENFLEISRGVAEGPLRS